MRLDNPFTRARQVYYGWWLVGLSSLVLAFGEVPLFLGMSAWFVVLKDQFRWSAGELAWAFAIGRIEAALLAPFAGVLMERLGTRRMLLIGMFTLGAGFVLFSRVQELWQLYLVFLLLNFGGTLGYWHNLMTMINNWFVRRRATAMALATEGNGIGAVLILPVLAWAIDPDAERFGWRATAATLGFLLMAASLPVSRIVRNRPEEYGLLPDGDASVTVQEPQRDIPIFAEESSVTWRQAIRTRTFWMITGANSTSMMLWISLVVHQGIMLEDREISLQMIGWVVSTYMGTQAVFSLVGGYLGDRIHMRIALSLFTAIQAASVFVLVGLAHSAPMALLFGFILGIGFGGRTPLSVAIFSEYFGRRSYASIFGMSLVPINIALVVGPLFAGYMFDATGKYDIPFISFAVLNLIGACVYLMLGQPSPSSVSKGNVQPSTVKLGR